MPRRKQEWAKRVKKERFRKRYLTRMQATRLLQVDSMNFRRMTILKGIYPRAIGRSKQKASGNDKQYYLAKEIKWLVHDPVLAKIAAFTAWQKKMRKAKAQHDFQRVGKLNEPEIKPQYVLEASIRERYPYFADAVKDLDDAMTNVSLYAFLTPEVQSESTIEFHHALPTGLHDKAKFVQKDFLNYVVKSKALTRAFISIKGYYYEAIINGERVMWLMPHEFASKFPSGVQQYILITFLEFQVELMRFVLFKLNKDLSKKLEEQERLREDHIDDNAADFGADGVAAVSGDGAAAATAHAGSSKAQLEKQFKELLTSDQRVISQLFAKFVFYISREVPAKHARFIIEACGGRVVEELAPTVTHYVVDRPALLPPHTKQTHIEYVQPQYLWDCLNARLVLPVNGYRMGEVLPPHVSPFTVSITGTDADNAAVEDVRKRHPKIVSYVPDRVHDIRALKDPNYSRFDPKNLVDDAGSDISEEDRMQLAPDSDDDEQVALTGDQLREASKKPKWEEETVQEHARRSKLSAFKVQKQRELNLMNRPRDDATAAKKAEVVRDVLNKRANETRDQRVKRKLRDALKQTATSKKMRLQVAKAKTRRYYNMVNSNVKGAAKHEGILSRKAAAIKKGRASTDGKTFHGAGSGKKGKTGGNSAAAKKAASPYKNLPKWVR